MSTIITQELKAGMKFTVREVLFQWKKMNCNLWFSNSWKEEDCLHCSELIAVHLQLIFTGLDIVNMDSCDCFLHD